VGQRGVNMLAPVGLAFGFGHTPSIEGEPSNEKMGSPNAYKI